MKTTQIAAYGLALLTTLTASAQPTRTAYRCESNGKVTYTDAPCLNAQSVDTTPTRGLDKSTGSTKKGADVAREEQRELIGEALRPLTGQDAKQFASRTHRQRLTTDERHQCEQLDRALRTDADPQTRLGQRKRYKALRC